jgi:ketosteroid isomerase-like protein
MSSNLDLVRSIFADWERGDFSSVEWAHPEIALVVPEGLAPGSWTGVSALMEWRDDQLSAWEEVRVEADEYRELDGERVLVLSRMTGRGRASGLELRARRGRAVLFHLRDGKVTRQVTYIERDRALADLGLAADADSQDA